MASSRYLAVQRRLAAPRGRPPTRAAFGDFEVWCLQRHGGLGACVYAVAALLAGHPFCVIGDDPEPAGNGRARPWR